MPVLDLYKTRQHHTVRFGEGDKAKEYKFPAEYTVEEVERLLELQARREALEAQEAAPEGTPERAAQLNGFMVAVFDQVEVLFQHYQPEMTAEELKNILTRNEALGILGFFDKYRFRALKEMSGDSKKKSPLVPN